VKRGWLGAGSSWRARAAGRSCCHCSVAAIAGAILALHLFPPALRAERQFVGVALIVVAVLAAISIGAQRAVWRTVPSPIAPPTPAGSNPVQARSLLRFSPGTPSGAHEWGRSSRACDASHGSAHERAQRKRPGKRAGDAAKIRHGATLTRKVARSLDNQQLARPLLDALDLGVNLQRRLLAHYRRATVWASTRPRPAACGGGAERDRTADLVNAMHIQWIFGEPA